MASPRRDSYVQAVISDYVARDKVRAFVVAATFVTVLVYTSTHGLTGKAALLIAVLCAYLSTLARRGVGLYFWTYKFRRLLAADSLPYPGVKAARAWRKRERQRMNTLRKQFPVACDAHGVFNRAKVTPGLQRMRSLSNGDITVTVNPSWIGVKEGIEKLRAKSRDIARICDAPDLAVKPMGLGSAQLTFMWTERMARLLPIQEMKEAPPNRLAYAEDEDGNVMSIAMMSVLVVGMTGGGKSSLLWALITDALRKVTFWIYVIDPKGGQELGGFKPAVGKTIGRMTVKDWGKRTDAKRIIDDVAAELARRQDLLIGKRKWTQDISKEFPLIILPIDEALTLMMEIDKPTLVKLMTILAEGRSAGVMAIILSQLPQKEVLNQIRGVIAQRLSLKTESPTDTGLVFGPTTAEADGAKCSQITTPGIGYARVEGVVGYSMFKGYYVDDDDITAIMDRGLPDGMGGLGKAEPSELYCVYYYRSSDRQLLYVGITNNFARRDSEHKADFLKGDPKHYWYQYVDPTKTVIRAADNKAQAKAEESREIAAWKPPGNTAENQGNPRQGAEIEAIPHHHWWNRTPKPVDLDTLTPTEPQPLPLDPAPTAPSVEEWQVPEPVDVGLDVLRPEMEPEPEEPAAVKPAAPAPAVVKQFKRRRGNDFRPVNAPPRKKPAAVQGPDRPVWEDPKWIANNKKVGVK